MATIKVSPGDPWRSVVESSLPGTVIEFNQGSYTNPGLNLPEGVTIRGIGTVEFSNGSWNLKGNDVTIENITKRSKNFLYTIGGWSGLKILNCKNIAPVVVGDNRQPLQLEDGLHDSLIQDCYFENSNYNTLQITGKAYSTSWGGWNNVREPYNITINRCTFKNNNEHGLIDFFGNSHDIKITNCNLINGNAGGIYVHQGMPYNCYFGCNRIYNGVDGIHADSGIRDSTFEKNVIYNNTQVSGSLRIRPGATYNELPSGNNTFIDNYVCGVIGIAGTATLTDNNFTSQNQTIPCGTIPIKTGCTPPTSCIPNWQCEQPLNGYEKDGCGNRRINPVCNSIIPPPPPPVPDTGGIAKLFALVGGTLILKEVLK